MPGEPGRGRAGVTATRVTLLALMLTVAPAWGTTAGAQESEKPPTPAHTGFKALVVSLGADFAHLPTRGNLVVALVGGAASLAAHPFDQDVNIHFKGHDATDVFFAPGKIIGYGATQAALSGGTYVVGRLSHHPKVSHLGMDLIRAQLLTAAMTYGIKYAVGRQRPDGSSGGSFPSGHASVTFASATALERHLGWRAAVPTYLIASYVAASRLHENRHYLSDVTFGAAVGVIAGRTATRHGRSNYSLAPVKVPGGMALLFVRTRN